jgi:spore maturation protein CgeB
MKLLSLTSMYQGSLDSFYLSHSGSAALSYDEHYNLLLNYTTEFTGSYTRNFINLGLDARFIVSNDSILQEKWRLENNLAASDSADLMFEQIIAFQPEILWIENLTFLDKLWFDKVRSQIHSIKLIIAYHCAPYTRKYLDKLRNADFVVTCTPGLFETMRNEGMKAYMVYHGFDSHLLERLDKENGQPQAALTFSGSLITGDTFHSARITLIERLIREKINVALYVTLEKSFRIRAKQAIYFLSRLLKIMGMSKIIAKYSFFEYGRILVKQYSSELRNSNHPPQYGMSMYNLISRSKILLNIHTGVAGNFAGNMRMFEATGVGSCLLTDNKSNMNELFDTEKEVVVYNDTADCIKKVKWLLEHDEEREKIAKAGQKKTLEFHTVENRCREIIEIINKELTERLRDLET